MKLLKQQIQFVQQHSCNDFIFAIISNVKGSSYKKTGAIKVIASDGTSCGLISGGCLEGDIVAQALNPRFHNSSCVFDTLSREDRFLGSGTGCQGQLTIEFSPMNKHEALDRLNHLLYSNTLNVHIIGAGLDLDPLQEILRSTGWNHWFYTADKNLREQRQMEGWSILPIIQPKMDWVIDRPDRTAVLLMSHSYPMDLDILSQLKGIPVKYIGILGPEKRKLQMLEDLQSVYQITSESYKSSLIEGPLGFPGLGKGELAVALSITSRLQQFFFSETSQ